MPTDALIRYKTPRHARISGTVFYFISGFGYSAWASRIPSIQRHLHLNEAQLGAVLFAMPAGLMLTLPVTGNLLSRFSSRSIMFFGAMVYNITLALLGFATHTWQLAVLLFCFGSSRNLFNLSLNAQSVSVQSLYSRSIITFFHGVWSMAGFAGAALGYLMVTFNIATTWHLMGVGITMIIAALIFYPETIYHKPSAVEKKPVFALPDKFLLKFSLICFACMACENTMYDWSGIYFEKALHTSKQTATAAFVFYMVAMTASRFAGDIPQCMLNGAHGRAIWLERAALADLQHHPFDVGGVLTDQSVAKMQHPWLEVSLGKLHLAEAIEALVRVDPQDRVVVIGRHHRQPHVGDAQLGRFRMAADGVFDRAHRLSSNQRRCR